MIDTAIVFALADTTRHIYSFTLNSAVLTHLTQQLTAGEWVDVLRQSYTYDDHDRPVSLTRETRINGTLTLVNREICTYDARGNPVIDRYEVRDSAGDAWRLYYANSYLYDEHGNLLLEQVEYVGAGPTKGGGRITYVRDEQGNALLYLYETYDNGWMPSMRFTTTRDDRGHTLSEIREVWSNGHWVNTEKTDRSFDSRGRMLTESYEDWTNGQWQPWSRVSLFYDEQDSVREMVYESASNGRLVNSTRSIRMFEDGKEKSRIVEQWTAGGWVARSRVVTEYNTIGDRIAYTEQYSLDGRWWVARRKTYDYDAERRVTGEYEDFYQEGRWTGAGRSTWTFNAAGVETVSQYVTIDSLGQTTYGTRLLSAYDQHGSPSQLAYEEWQNGSWQPANYYWTIFDSSTVDTQLPSRYTPHNAYYFAGYRVELRNSTIGPDPNSPAGISLDQNYPNPFNPHSAIGFQTAASGRVTLTVYDILGREVVVLVDRVLESGTYRVDFNGTGLPSGAYFYRLRSGSSTATKKMVLLR